VARRLSATSSSRRTLSLNSRTCRPAVRAWWASRAAYSPGTEMSATFASLYDLTASGRVRGRGAPPSSASASRPARAPSPAWRAASASSTVSATTASTRSLIPAWSSSVPATPRDRRSSRFASVPITADAYSTPSDSRMARVADMRSTESR